MVKLKTFQDLKFKPRFSSRELEGYKRVCKLFYEERKDATRARMKFPNGYEVCVLCGTCFYSNGKDRYEVSVMHDGHVCYDTPVTNDVIPYQTAEEVTEIMKEIQELKPKEDGKSNKVR